MAATVVSVVDEVSATAADAVDADAAAPTRLGMRPPVGERVDVDADMVARMPPGAGIRSARPPSRLRRVRSASPMITRFAITARARTVRTSV